MRADPVLTAARFINTARERAVKLNCLASVGIISAFPGSVNTVPEKVVFSLDLRSRDEKSLELLELELHEEQKCRSPFANAWLFDPKDPTKYSLQLKDEESLGERCRVEWQTDSISHAVKFDESCIQCVEDSVKASFGHESTLDISERMVSGAGASLTFHSYLNLHLV